MKKELMENELILFSQYFAILASALMIAGLYQLKYFNISIAHSIAEVFGIVIAGGIFMLGWNSRRFQDNSYFLFLGIAYLFVGILELFHILSTPGIEVFNISGSDLAMQLRVTNRYIESLSLLLAPLFIRRKFNLNYLFLGYMTTVSFLLWSILYWYALPMYPIGEMGFTGFIVANEIIICLILLAAVGIMFQRRKDFDPAVLRLLVASIILTIASELAFIIIRQGQEQYNLIGHLLKIASFYLIYKAIIEIGLMKPYRVLFRNLKQSEDALQTIRSHLEETVEKRTEDLMTANKQLQAEIMECSRVQENFERSTYRNKLILDSVGEGIYGVDLQGNTTFINPIAITMTGYEMKDLIGRHQHELLHHSKPDGSFYAEEECPIYAAMKDGIPRHIYDEVFWRKDGSSFPVEYISTPIQEKGKIVGAVVVFRDITSRKQAEEELRQSQSQSQKQMAEAQRLAHVGSYEWDIAKDKVSWSEELYRIMGVEEGQTIDLSLEEVFTRLIHPDFQNHIRDLFEKALKARDKEPFEYESHRVLRADGAWRMLKGRAEVITDAAGNPIKIIGFLQDITKLKQAEDAMRESEKKYRMIVENAQEGIMTIDEEAEITFVNSRFARMLGCTGKEMAGKPFYFFITEKDAALAEHFFERCKQGLKEREEFELLHKDGSIIYASMATTPLFDESGHFIGAQSFVTDITGLKQAEEEKAKIQAQLLQSQKMEAIGVLAGGVAHDFNNLLTVVQGYSSMAMQKIDKADPLFRDMNQIHLAAGRAANLTRQLLLFSRKQPMEPTLLDFNKIIENMLKMLHRLIGEDISIDIKLEPDIRPMRGDEGNIEQVIMNLAVNARDAMPHGGRLTITTENVNLDKDSSAFIPEAQPGRFIRLSIADTGVGMDKETMSRIFEPFFSTKGLGKGTGLGLSVVYGIIKQHGGWVNVYSEPGNGSVFKIYLPASSAPPEGKMSETISLKEVQGKNERILVVEDEEAVRKVTVRVLRENGYSVTEAASAQEALKFFEQEKGGFDLVVSDVILPDHTGIELVERFILRRPELKVLLVSGYTDQKSQWPKIREMGFRFLQKPYFLPGLLQTLRKMMESKE